MTPIVIFGFSGNDLSASGGFAGQVIMRNSNGASSEWVAVKCQSAPVDPIRLLFGAKQR